MHSHGSSIKLTKNEQDILESGISQLLEMTENLNWKNFPSDKHPLPLTQMSYQETPKPSDLVDAIKKRMKTDPVSVLEDVLALLELFVVNQEYSKDVFHEDMNFIQRHCFAVKRLNGWVAVIGDVDKENVEQSINEKWNFRFYNGIGAEVNSYMIMSMLVRYAFVYGGIEFGDAHALSHFLEDFGPGVIVCQGKLTDLELTLSLAAMKIGVPLIVPTDYPFTLGRKIKTNSQEDIANAVSSFPNIRKLLHTPDIQKLPDFCSRDNLNEDFEIHKGFGVTKDSFYMLTKGKVKQSGIDVQGELCDAKECSMGIKITIDEEPMDAFDQKYIERKIASDLSLMSGVQSKYTGEKLEISNSEDVEISSLPQQIGDILSYSIQHHFPKIKQIKIEIIFDEIKLKELAPKIRFEKLQREKIISSTTEETIDKFYRCTSCSPFAPDHICIITPERPPQCGKSFEQVKTGALYAYDDMTNVHHNPMHLDINLYGVVEKGQLLDSSRGEWSGANEHAEEITQGRTTRIFLHTLDEYPHTGCSCFRLIIFRTNKPSEGIGIMDYSYKGKAPDGRNWRDLHYAIAGKQVPGMVAASFAYLSSPKFLQADGGWENIVWVSPRVAEKSSNFIKDTIKIG